MLALLLDDEVLPDIKASADRRELFASTMPEGEAQGLLASVGFADVERLVARWPRLQRVEDVAKRYGVRDTQS